MNHVEVKDLPITLTVAEVATILRVGRNTAYHLVQEGEIRYIRCGRKIIIPRDALAEFLSKAN